MGMVDLLQVNVGER